MDIDQAHDHRNQANLDRPAYLSLAQAARLLPAGRGGRPVHVATLGRWIATGSHSGDGEVVRLQAVRMGSRWLTTREWLDDFARRLTPSFRGASTPSDAAALPRRDRRQTSRELDAAGF